MPCIDRLPAIPLLASDPYLSIWMPADTMTQTDACHWSGPAKPIRGVLTVDGAACRFLGAGPEPEADLTELKVTATRTCFTSEFAGVRLETCFASPALPQDLDLLSMPVTLVFFRLFNRFVQFCHVMSRVIIGQDRMRRQHFILQFGTFVPQSVHYSSHNHLCFIC